MLQVPEVAVLAAAHAIFTRNCTVTDCSPAVKAQRWIQCAEHYREMARTALIAALPYIQEDDEADEPHRS
jgi:hypothetical protein